MKDQTRRGVSGTGKSPGELDIFITTQDGEPFSIIEALNLSSLKKDYIDLHLKKIFTYDTNGLQRNYIIVYSEAKKFISLWEKYIDYIPTIEYPYKFEDFREEKLNFNELRIGKATHIRNEQQVVLYHLFVNFAQ